MRKLDKSIWATSLKLTVALGITATLLLFNLALESTPEELKHNPVFYPFEWVSTTMFEPQLHNPFIAIGVLVVILLMNCMFALPVAVLLVWLWRGRGVKPATTI